MTPTERRPVSFCQQSPPSSGRAAGGGRTHVWPDHLPVDGRLVLVDLGPHLALAVKCRGGLPLWDLGDVEGHRPGVGDGGFGVVVQGLTGCYAQGALGGAASLVAADLFRVDVGDWAIALVVGCLADVLPVA